MKVGFAVLQQNKETILRVSYTGQTIARTCELVPYKMASTYKSYAEWKAAGGMAGQENRQRLEEARLAAERMEAKQLSARERSIQLKMTELLKKKEEAEIEAEAKRRLAAKLHPGVQWNGRPLPSDPVELEAVRVELVARGIAYKPRAGTAPLRLRDGLIRAIRDARKDGKL